ncbi:MAG: ribonuclease domain-containing protein [Pseudomonadota bacterium]|jgi:hypothetical protein
MFYRKWGLIASAAILAASLWTGTAARAASCEDTVHLLSHLLHPRTDEAELTEILETLNKSRNARLPEKFITKRDAQRAGWKPGTDLWAVPALKGKSIGGDKFSNREGKLPAGEWREADLDYKGGHRGGKRLVFSADGDRRVTVDHYRTFVEIPPCQ